MSVNLSNYFVEVLSDESKKVCMAALEKSMVDMYNIVLEAHKITLAEAALKRRHYKQRNWMAETMYGNIIGLLYDNYPDLMKMDKERCHYVEIDQLVRLYPKKLNSNYIPANIITDSVKKRRGQEIKFDDTTQIYILYVGGVLADENWQANLIGVYGSYIDEYYPKNNKWTLNLKDYAKSNAIVTQLTKVEVEEESLVKIPSKETKTGSSSK